MEGSWDQYLECSLNQYHPYSYESFPFKHFVPGSFSRVHFSTSYELTLANKKRRNINLDFWEINHLSLVPDHVDGIVLMYDITKKESFQEIRRLTTSVKEILDCQIPRILVANEMVTEENHREISNFCGYNFAVYHEMEIFQVNTKGDPMIIFGALDFLLKKIQRNGNQPQIKMKIQIEAGAIIGQLLYTVIAKLVVQFVGDDIDLLPLFQKSKKWKKSRCILA
jgi:hypothetical protein